MTWYAITAITVIVYFAGLVGFSQLVPPKVLDFLCFEEDGKGIVIALWPILFPVAVVVFPFAFAIHVATGLLQVAAKRRENKRLAKATARLK